MALIALLTDFGVSDAYVGIMKGVILGLVPQVTLVDLCHEVPPQDVRAGAFLLKTAVRYFPAGAIHLVVVDPGVGTARRIVAVRAGGQCFVAPDNGVLRWAVDDAPGGAEQIVRVENPAYRLPDVSTTFHGRDVMAPAAAALANGTPLAALGPTIDSLAGDPFPEPHVAPGSLTGEVVYVDHYGNCITNLPASMLSQLALGEPDVLPVHAGGARLPVVRTYGAGQPGQPLCVTGSSGYLEIAVRNGSAARALSLIAGSPVLLDTLGA
jgi:S-adenosyl-L-methionine hydrolase (adenosine-forming)